jgi:hypothetical protein
MGRSSARSALVTCRTFVITLAIVVTGALGPHGSALAQGDPWYTDADIHWSGGYIRILWQEDVTDGVISPTNPGISFFYPDSYITRAQFIVLLSKVFGLTPLTPEVPSYPDVPKTYTMLYNKPAWHFIEGALAGGISLVSPGLPFFPDGRTPREDAVAFLVRSLDLEPYAQSLSQAQVNNILRRFVDWQNISLDRRNAMACAVQLGIIEGYEDGRVKPAQHMTRGEAATVVYRSCLIRFSARKVSFSPDGDGLDDTVTFDFAYLKNRAIESWEAVIASDTLIPVYHFNKRQASGPPPQSVIWDGRDNSGNLLPRGLYHYQAWVRDTRGNLFLSLTRPLYLELHSLSARLSPTKCVDGQTLRVTAETIPAASTVTAQFVEGPLHQLTSSDGGLTWALERSVGPPLPFGEQPVVVTATFPGAVRTEALFFERVQDAWLLATVEPNPASWGQSLILGSLTSASIQAVSVSLFGEHASLKEITPGKWTGTQTVPHAIPGGLYPAEFTGWTPNGSVSATVWVEIKDPDSLEIVYILSK